MSHETGLVQMIRSAEASKAESVPLHIRLPPELSSFIDNVADHLDMSKQQVALAMLVDARKLIEKEMNLEALEASEQPEAAFHILNTNKRHSIEDHTMMVEQGIAAAFMDSRKLNIERIQADDVVFLYENGKGIVGYGRATGDVIISDRDGLKDEARSQELKGYVRLDKPLSAKQIRKQLDRHIPFMRTMISLPDGRKILDALEAA